MPACRFLGAMALGLPSACDDCRRGIFDRSWATTMPALPPLQQLATKGDPALTPFTARP